MKITRGGLNSLVSLCGIAAAIALPTLTGGCLLNTPGRVPSENDADIEPDADADADRDEDGDTPPTTETVFDWVTPGSNQVGSYQESVGSARSDGTAQLKLNDDPAWSELSSTHRLVLDATGAGEATTIPLSFDLSTLPIEFFSAADVSGADLLPVGSWGEGSVLDSWLESFDATSRSGVLWFRADPLPASDDMVSLYVGGPDATRLADEILLFTYDSHVNSAVALFAHMTPSSLSIASFIDGNSIEAGSQSLELASAESASVAAEAFDVEASIGGLGPFGGVFESRSDVVAPLALASTSLVAPVPARTSDEHIVVLYAPFDDATVEVSRGDRVVDDVTVTAGSTALSEFDVRNTSTVSISSDSPVVASHGFATERWDPFAFTPPGLELIGGASGRVLIGTTADETEVVVTYNDETTESSTMGIHETWLLEERGFQGDGHTIRITANHPITALTYGDFDGADASVFISPSLLGRRYIVPADAQYLMIASYDASSSCTLTDPDGALVDEQTGSGAAYPTPGRMYFGETDDGVHVYAGSILSCDGSVWVIMEHADHNGEINLWPARMHRPALSTAPELTVDRFETRYSQDPQWVATPTFTPADDISAWTGFELGTATSTPTGTTTSFQLSSDGGTTWMRYDGSAWVAATGDDGSTAEEVRGGLSTFPTDGTLTIRLLLSSDDGVDTPTVGEISVSFRL